MTAIAQAYYMPYPKAKRAGKRHFFLSGILHLVLLLAVASVAGRVSAPPLPEVKVLEINVIGKEDLALKGTGQDFSVGPLPSDAPLAAPPKAAGPQASGNTPKVSRALRSEQLQAEPAIRPVLKAKGPLFSSGGSIASPGVGREKIYVSAKNLKTRFEQESKGASGEGLVGVSGEAIDLSAKRGAGGASGEGNFISGGKGSVTGGNTLSRRGQPILASYGVSKDPILQGGRARPAELPAPSGDFFSITGPLRGRKILKLTLPKYPRWAEEQGIEAMVAVRITVTAAGKVKPDMVVEQTSGYPELDKVVTDALRRMVFSPLPNDAGGREEWGVAAFNFKLDKRST